MTYRDPMMAKVHIAKKELGLDDETYRAILKRVTGKDSSKGLGYSQLVAVLDEFKRLGWKPNTQPKRAGNRPMAGDPQSAMIRALWLSLYHLGEARNPSEAALSAWIEGRFKVSALQFLTPALGRAAIESLKSWCARVGYQVQDDALQSKRELLHVLWGKLHAAGIVRIADPAALDNWFSTAGISPHTVAISHLSAAQLDLAADKLGAWLRSGLAKRAAK